MNGLALARDYWENIGRPAFQQNLPELEKRMAVGLAGEGSECLGYDDAISRDHDWGPGFCIWLTERDHALHGAAVQTVYRKLPGAYGGYPPRRELPQAWNRVGCFSVPAWYIRYIGCPNAPETLAQWRKIPEHFLATATNGLVFQDPTGEFTEIRQRLLAFYPEDIRRKKLAHRLAIMAQAGQYNLPRSLRRGETVAASMAQYAFMQAGMSAVYLLNRRYAPFYKWMHRGLRELPLLSECGDWFAYLTAANEHESRLEIVEKICRMIAEETVRQGLSQKTDAFLMLHAQSVFSGINNTELRETHIMED